VNIIAASIEAYVDALNLLLDEEHLAGATEAAGNRKRVRPESATRAARTELDEDAAHHDTTAWFER
jgi:hypothetical protein